MLNIRISVLIRLCRNRMFRLKNVEGDIPGEKIKLSYVGNDSKKEVRNKYDANRPAQKFSVKCKKGREWLIMRTGHFSLNLPM